MATKAQIQVSVAGFKQLQNLQASVKALAPQIDQANAAFIRFSGASQKTLPIISNFSRVLRENQKLFASTILSNKEAATAAKNQTLAEKELNNELARRNAVLNKARGIKSDPIAKSIARNRAKFSDPNAPAFENIRDLPSGSKRPSRFAQFSQDATKISAPRSPVEAKIQADLKNQKRITQEIADIRSRSAKKIEASNKRVEASLKKRKKILEDSRKEEIKAQTRIEKIRSKDSVRRKRDLLNRPDIKIRRGLTGRSAGARATRQRAAGSALIGGGFPLLFGGGPLQALAGGLGGGIGELLGKGGGFAGSIAATAIAQTIQGFLDGISQLGNALGPFTQNTQAVTDALGLQGSAQEAQIKLIEQVEGKTAAFNAATAILARQIGQGGVDAIEKFANTGRLMSQEFAKLNLQLQNVIARIINFTNEVLGLSEALERGEARDIVAGAAAGGDEQAQQLLNQRENQGFFSKLDNAINNTFLGKLSQFLPGTAGGLIKGAGGLTGGASVLSGQKADDERLTKQEKIFAAGEKVRIQAGAITSESDLTIKSLEEELDLRNRIVENEKNMSKTLAEKVSKVEQEFDFREKTLKTTLEQLTKERDKIQENAEKRFGINKQEQEDIDIANAKIAAQEGLITNNNKLKEDSIVLTKKLHTETDKVADAFEKIGLEILDSVKDGIAGLIKGTSTLSDLLNNVADKFLDVALNQALFGSILGSKGEKGGGILGALKLFGNGGRPPVGKPSIVGEKGPELFVPRSSGMIVPNNKLGGGGGTNNVVVNVDASGSDVQGDDAGGQELGTLIAAAVQGELVKQQRPGGLLNR